MQGPSHSALIEARAELDRQIAGDIDGVRLAEDLLSMSAVVHGSAVLRRSLADPTREARDRTGVVDRLFAGRVGDPAQRVAGVAVAQRWTDAADLTLALEELGVEALLAHAQDAGRLSRVEDELFRFQRIVLGDSSLQAALADRQAPVTSKTSLVAGLLSEKAAPETVRLSSHAVSSRTRRFGPTVESYLDIAARRQQQVTAVVTSAVPLTEQQLDRLVSILSEQYGRGVHANVVVDTAVIGGIRVEIGDEVIEGTISNRLDDARRRLTG